MPWCPSCRTEYREDFYKCSDCGSELVDELSEEPLTDKQISEADDWRLIYTCTDEMEADMIESFLDAEKIDTFRNYPGFSDISRIVGGMTKLGVNIYVREGQMDEAANALRDLVPDFKDGEGINNIQAGAEEVAGARARAGAGEDNKNYGCFFLKILVIGFVLIFLFGFVPSVFVIIKALLQ